MNISDAEFDATARGDRPSIDLDWYATDDIGQVALLSSAGFADVPDLVFESKQDYDLVATHLENLPSLCGYRLLENTGRDNKWWTDAASKGLFAFDWNWNMGL